MKKLSSLFLLALLPLMASAYEYHYIEDDGIYYTLNLETKHATVSSGSKDITAKVIPWVITYNDETYRVTSIGYKAFNGCSGLTSINIPISVTSIRDDAFCGCSGLTAVMIPHSVISIGGGAFYGCSGLTSVTIPNSVTSIDRCAFLDCSSLTDVYCYAEDVPTTDSYAFYNVNISNATLYVPHASIDAYKTTSPWSGFGTIVAIPDADLRGDVNGDGKVDMDDATFVTNIILGTTDAIEAADVNNDGQVNMPDAMFIVNKVLKGKFPDE